MSAREYLIDASAYWRIDRGAVLAAAWRDHLERGLVWICPPTEMEICRRVSEDQHMVHVREFTDTYVQVELHHPALPSPARPSVAPTSSPPPRTLHLLGHPVV